MAKSPQLFLGGFPGPLLIELIVWAVLIRDTRKYNVDFKVCDLGTDVFHFHIRLCYIAHTMAAW